MRLIGVATTVVTLVLAFVRSGLDEAPTAEQRPGRGNAMASGGTRCHGAGFDVRAGEVLAPPAPLPVIVPPLGNRRASIASMSSAARP